MNVIGSVRNAISIQAALKSKVSSASLKSGETGLSQAPKADSKPVNVDDYLTQLRKNNPSLDISMGPNPRQGTQKNTVGISRTFLQKCLEDPEAAKKLEYDLGTIPMALKAKEGWAARDGVELIGGGMRVEDDGSLSSGHGGMMVTKQSGSASGSTRSNSVPKNVEAKELAEKRRARKKEQDELQEKLLAERAEQREFAQEQLNATDKTMPSALDLEV